jgi:hypothetical protein
MNQTKLFGILQEARLTNTYERKLAMLAKVDLLIIDDFGIKPLRTPQDEDLHELIAERYERRTTMLTSNLDLPEWSQAFPNKLLGAATIDRIRNGAYVLVLEGNTYRTVKKGPEQNSGPKKPKKEASRACPKGKDHTQAPKEGLVGNQLMVSHKARYAKLCISHLMRRKLLCKVNR